MRPKIIMTGATGLIGRELCASFSSCGYEVIALTSDTLRAQHILGKTATLVEWNYKTPSAYSTLFTGKYFVIHLAGAGIADKKWSDKYKEIVIKSRTETAKSLLQSIAISGEKPIKLISASAVGYYGTSENEVFDETSLSGTDFLSEVARNWEAATDETVEMGIKRAIVRIGIVLTAKGGAYAKMVLPYQFFIGGPIGDGKQYMSWVHIADLIGIFTHLIENEDLTGIFNGTAPNPVSGNEFAKELAKSLHRPNLFRVPGKIIEILMQESSILVLKGQQAKPINTLKSGYEFIFPDLPGALQDIATSIKRIEEYAYKKCRSCH